MNDADTELDVKGLNCPMPLLKAKKALNDMEAGMILRVLATDPGSERDFEGRRVYWRVHSSHLPTGCSPSALP